MVNFQKTATQYTPFDKIYNSDGTVDLLVQAHAALTANQPYKVLVNEYGYVSAALADDTTYYYVGVPRVAIASGAIGLLQIGGEVAAMITPSLSVSVGHALVMLNGAVADAGADYSGAAGQFAVCQVDSSASTTQAVLLIPERILSTT